MTTDGPAQWRKVNVLRFLAEHRLRRLSQEGGLEQVQHEIDPARTGDDALDVRGPRISLGSGAGARPGNPALPA